MTEQEWLESSDVDKMLEFIKNKTGGRKLRLFAVACCKEIIHLMEDEGNFQAVETAEKFADGLVSEQELQKAKVAAIAAAKTVAVNGNWEAAWATAKEAAKNSTWKAARKSQADILRSIVGNPFQQVCAQDEWLSRNDGVVSRIAERIYWGRAWEELPILADALEEAGCDSTEILSSLRRQEKHYRGYWVLDILTGRS